MNIDIDENINGWAYNLDIPNVNEYLNNLLKMGHMVVTQAQISTDTSQTDRLMESHHETTKMCMDNTAKRLEYALTTMTQKMETIEQRSQDTTRESQNKLVDMVETFTGKTKTSASRGDIAENFIENICQESLPDKTVKRSSGIAHEADFQIFAANCPAIMLESKNYTCVVSKKEIDKLKSDMDRMDMNYGLFVSFNSRITGKKHMEIETYDDKTILYLSDFGFNKDIIIMGIKTLTQIAIITNNVKQGISREFIKDKINQIILCLNDLPQIMACLTKTRTTLHTEVTNIKNSLDNIHVSFITNESEIKRILGLIEHEINYKLSDLGSIEYEEVENIEYLIEDVDIKKQPMLRNILSEIHGRNYSVRKSDMNEYSYDIYNITTGKIISKLNIKSKIKLSIPEICAEFEFSKKNSVKHLDCYFQLLEKL